MLAICNSLIRLKKNLFAIFTNINYGQSTKTLSVLFKSLVRRKYDYDLIAYGSTSRTTLNHINFMSRSIIRLILGSRQSTPVYTLYVDVGLEPAEWTGHCPAGQKIWLATSYIVKPSTNLTNLTYAMGYDLFHKNSVWRIQRIPSLAKETIVLCIKNLSLFSSHPDRPPSTQRPAPPWICAKYHLHWFPLDKKTAMSCPSRAMAIFDSLILSFSTETTIAYTDGSLPSEKENTACATTFSAGSHRSIWLHSIFSSRRHHSASFYLHLLFFK